MGYLVLITEIKLEFLATPPGVNSWNKLEFLKRSDVNNWN